MTALFGTGEELSTCTAFYSGGWAGAMRYLHGYLCETCAIAFKVRACWAKGQSRTWIVAGD